MSRDAEQARSFGFVAVRLLQRALDVFSFDLAERGKWVKARLRRRRADSRRARRVRRHR